MTTQGSATGLLKTCSEFHFLLPTYLKPEYTLDVQNHFSTPKPFLKASTAKTPPLCASQIFSHTIYWMQIISYTINWMQIISYTIYWMQIMSYTIYWMQIMSYTIYWMQAVFRGLRTGRQKARGPLAWRRWAAIGTAWQATCAACLVLWPHCCLEPALELPACPFRRAAPPHEFVPQPAQPAEGSSLCSHCD